MAELREEVKTPQAIHPGSGGGRYPYIHKVRQRYTHTQQKRKAKEQILYECVSIHTFCFSPPKA